ncbi:MAG: glycoside hydrolase/phage tail family protein, partial [Loktanella sp.]|nr:glycoside hydrolase/phage tail family protein [Loktanella sp.]
AAQIRTPITDGDGEPWVWRYKDLHGWWANRHHDRIGGVRQVQPTAWQPQSKPFWFTEFGCAAIDRGTNQPNKFLDPKSSESLLPRYSGGMRDDFMQMQYLRAVYRHFTDPARNPMSEEYAGRMLDVSRTHVWAWDTRPFPVFPGKTALWSDGPNYHRGHWLNGRASARTLAGVVAEICEGAGITSYDVSRLYGVVRGYVVTDLATARSALQPLMLVHGIEAVERDGQLVFFNRSGREDAALDLPKLADHPETGTPLELTRAPESEIAGRIQIGYLDAEADYEAAMAETVHADDRTVGVARSEFAMALTRSEAARTAARWIAEARVAQDSARFALPPSMSDVATGDVVALGDGRYRIDRIEEAGLRLAEATRVTDALYLPQERLEEGARLKPFLAPTPVYMAFMDLPLLTGDEVPHAPHVAACASPWPGGAALYSAPQDSGYILQELFRKPDPMGVTRTELPKGRVGLWDRQVGLRVKMTAGTLSSAAIENVLSGGNTLAIGDGSEDGWEIVQFTDAVLVGPQEWEISGLLRGQAGSDAMMPDVWPKGSRVVVLNGAPRQISVPTSARGLPRHYRYGPVKHAVTQKSFRHHVLTFKGNGYRPYAPCHLRKTPTADDQRFEWVRRTRIDGDPWGQTEVPLGEERESYVVQVRLGGAVVRELTVSEPRFDYTDAQRLADTGGSGFTLWVAQVSARYGVGPFTGLAVG